MSKSRKNIRSKKQEEQGKKVLWGIAIAMIVLMVLMFVYYSSIA